MLYNITDCQIFKKSHLIGEGEQKILGEPTQLPLNNTMIHL